MHSRRRPAELAVRTRSIACKASAILCKVNQYLHHRDVQGFYAGENAGGGDPAQYALSELAVLFDPTTLNTGVGAVGNRLCAIHLRGGNGRQ